MSVLARSPSTMAARNEISDHGPGLPSPNSYARCVSVPTSESKTSNDARRPYANTSPAGTPMQKPDHAIKPPALPQATAKERRRRALEDHIAALANRFPSTFVAESWLPHKPLKLGIHLDIIERGALPPTECHRVLGCYCRRRLYQAALASGGARIDLDGQVAGEVTTAEQEAARDAVARLDAFRIEKAAAAKVALNAERAAGHSASNAQAKPLAASKLEPAPTVEACLKRSGLADLRRASLERKQTGGNLR
jgi:ProP effector